MAAMIPDRPLWLKAAPAIFLILWSAGFAVAKIAVTHAAPLTVLALLHWFNRQGGHVRMDASWSAGNGGSAAPRGAAAAGS